jgi:hypothetical protein
MAYQAGPAGKDVMFLRKHAAEPNSKMELLCQDLGSGLPADEGRPR